MKKRKVWRWILLIVLILAIVGIVLLITRPSGGSSQYTEETVRTGSIETYYSFTGNVAVRNSQAVAAKVNATVREVYVAQDDEVAEGGALLRLSNGDVIRADITGEVTDVHVSAGDAVAIGTPMVDIIDFDDLQVIVKVDEFDVAAVIAGKEATVTIDALGLVYEATVEHIAKHAQSVSGVGSGSSSINYYDAKLSAPQDERVLPGMKVDVRILSEQAEDVPLLSMDALRFDPYNKPFVYVKDAKGNVVEQSVTVGIQDGTTVEIVDGLRAGDVVQVPASRLLFPMMGQMR